MRAKVRDFIYLNTKRYVSLDMLRVVYWRIIIFPFLMLIMGIASINMTGVNWKSLFPFVSLAIWSLLYWVLVLIIQSKRTRKTFELRFLVNGISGLLVSSLFWIFYTSFNLVADKPILEFDFFLWILLYYFVFSAIYIGLIVLGVHKGAFKKIREAGNLPVVIALDAFFASLIPLAGVSGMITSKLLREHASVSAQNVALTISFVFLFFAPALAHMNFVQYYYCKKYSILCDEYGDTTSPKLELQINTKKVKVKKIKINKEIFEKNNSLDNSPSKKKIPLIIKMLVGIVSVPVVFFIVVFLVFFIKAIILD